MKISITGTEQQLSTTGGGGESEEDARRQRTAHIAWRLQHELVMMVPGEALQ
jgi:hypothetical protein